MAQATATRGIEVADPEAYRKKMYALLGDKDPIAVMGETPNVLAKFVDKHTPALMRTRPFPGKWTPNEIIGHLTDTEWVYGFRLRMILCEEKPRILGMDQELWVTGQRHNEREPADLVQMFRAMRSFNLSLWKTLCPSSLNRYGVHSERGEESLGTMLRMEAGHDLSHIDQITRYLEALRKAN